MVSQYDVKELLYALKERGFIHSGNTDEFIIDCLIEDGMKIN